MQRIEVSELNRLFEVFLQDGYRVLGPTLRDHAIVYDQIESSIDLPRGWTDDQEKGRYRLLKRNDAAFFGYNVGPQSWKQFLFLPREKLWDAVRTAEKTTEEFRIQTNCEKPQKMVFFGVRSCELAALRIQDKIFIRGREKDDAYELRRENVLCVVVNCTQAGSTCFCTSMGTGPNASGGFDLALTEVIHENDHYFLARSGSEVGGEVLSKLTTTIANEAEIRHAHELIEKTAASMGRTMNTKGIKELIYNNLEHPRWADVASRCLSCANCTLVCPTCFCSSVEDVTDVSGDHAARWRRWDSCFTLDHSTLHGGSVHASVKSRYRQWMTHKLASWIDQFGESGCVGCGRCITWCPVGIDITEEVAAIRKTSSPGAEN